MIVLETERLYLRELNSKDAEEMYQLNLDEEVIKYTADEAFESIAAAKSFLESYDHYKKHGFGRWAVIRKSDDQFLGWCGLKYTAELNEFDIGFRFFKMYWNNGYATESAKACIELGFTKFKMPAIIGRVRKENLASITVLKKMGLTYFKSFDFDGNDGFVYKIDQEI
jgi:[ribosomal protein S5]-alanine N-acetyltransferase